MDRVKLIQDSMNAAVASFIVMLTIALFKFFHKVPAKYIAKNRENRYVKGMHIASKINNNMNLLATETGAIYVHILRYHNGGPQRMTIIWEEIGRFCDVCSNDCAFKKNRTPVMNNYINQPLENVSIRNVLKSVDKKGKINDITKNDISDLSKNMWDMMGVSCVKEIYLKTKHDGLYCLSLLFCEKFESKNNVDGLMFQCANNLRDLL